MAVLLQPRVEPLRPPLSRPPATAAAVAGLCAVTAFNLLYVAYLCPLDLSPDEAHYWDWARHLDWSYYSKGPLVAWLIGGSCELFGHTPFAVRLPAVLCGSLLLAGLWRLAADVFRDDRFALRLLLLALTLPPLSAGSVLMTIDPPFLAGWAWAAVAVGRGRWLAAGACVAVGLLAKPTMLLFPACVGLWLWNRPDRRTHRYWGFVAVSSLGLLPPLAWNLANDWVSVRHLVGHIDNGGKPTPWYSPLAFVGGQCGLLLGFWFVAWAAALWRFRPTRAADAGVALLWWLSAPVFAAFLLASGRTAGQPNWPAAAYVSGFVLAVRELLRLRPAVRAAVVGVAVVLGLTLTVCLRWPTLVRPVFAGVLPPPSEHNPTPARKLDPTARLAGWRTLASAVDRVRREEKRRSGGDPLLAGMAWTLPGELGFYCDGHPVVYSFGSALLERKSQYDLWRPNPVADAQAFAGETFVYVGDEPPAGVFDTLERAAEVTHAEGGVPLATWTVWVCRGYRGFDRTTPARY